MLPLFSIMTLRSDRQKLSSQSDSTAKNTLIENVKICEIIMDVYPNNTKSSILYCEKLSALLY